MLPSRNPASQYTTVQHTTSSFDISVGSGSCMMCVGVWGCGWRVVLKNRQCACWCLYLTSATVFPSWTSESRAAQLSKSYQSGSGSPSGGFPPQGRWWYSSMNKLMAVTMAMRSVEEVSLCLWCPLGTARDASNCSTEPRAILSCRTVRSA